MYLLIFAASASAKSITLQWDSNQDERTVGYIVHYGHTSGEYTAEIDVADATRYTFPDLDIHQIYYICVSAYDAEGNRSDPSRELIVHIAASDYDADGIVYLDEIDTYGTDPKTADTDADGIDDGAELAYWGEGWSQDIDGDGIVNLLDPDAENDGLADGTEIRHGLDPTAAGDSLPTIYEDAEDGRIGRWRIYDNTPAGAAVRNVFDDSRQSRVIATAGSSTYNGFALLRDDGTHWNNGLQTVLRWSMQYPEAVFVYVDLDTTAGHRVLQYSPIDTDPLGSGEYIVYGIGRTVVLDAAWHTFVRDLQADLQNAQPGVAIRRVNYFMIRGAGRLDAVQLLDRTWDSDGDKLSDFDEVNRYHTDPDRIDTDADGLSDRDEIELYQTDPSRADTDDDGASDGEELDYWGKAWNQDSDQDGLTALLDADADNDGALDGLEIDWGFDPADAAQSPPTIYEDAEDGRLDGWRIFDDSPDGAFVQNVYDQERASHVIETVGDSTYNGFQLLRANGLPWNNRGQFTLRWSMRYPEAVLIYVDVETRAGHRYLQYSPIDEDRLGAGEYIVFGIGSAAVLDGQWHTYMRDLQADLKAAQPDNELLRVNSFIIRGAGRIDDIVLCDRSWDSDYDGLADFEEINIHGTDVFDYDSDQDWLDDGYEVNFLSTSPLNKNSDGDGLYDGEELFYWEDDWKADFDGDGLANLLDPDADGDSFADGLEVRWETDPADPDATPPAIYEDAEDGSIDRWILTAGQPGAAAIDNRPDDERESRVIALSADGDAEYSLAAAAGQPWNNRVQQVFSWRMQTAGDVSLAIEVETTAGIRRLTYTTSDRHAPGEGQTIPVRLDAAAADGQWHRRVRDLQADLQAAEPQAAVLQVNFLRFRGAASLDDVQLLDRDWDSDGDGLSDLAEAGRYGSDPDRIDTDADGLDDRAEALMFGTDPTRADSDGDGITDREENDFWADDWDADIDGDGVYALLDWDSDGDGVADGMEITSGFDPADAADNPASVYEDAEDGRTLRWRIYDDSPAGAAVANIDDSQRQSRVIETRGDGIANAYRLLLENGAPWGNTGQFVLRWSMRYPDGAYLYVDVETTAGHRFLQYAPIDDSPLGAGEYVVHGIGSAVYTQGRWQTYARDLQEDLQTAQPGVRIFEINSLIVRGTGRIDDVRLSHRFWDQDQDGLTDFDEVNGFFTDPDRLDTDGDGFADGEEVQYYGTDPTLADSDADGLTDRQERQYWQESWNSDIDSDSLTALLDPDTDGDGAPDGDELARGFDPGDPASTPPSVYEHAEDGSVAGWQVFDNNPAGAFVRNVYDPVRNSFVIETVGQSTYNGFQLLLADDSTWSNDGQFMLQWSMRYPDAVFVYVDLTTTAGHRFLQYAPIETDPLGSGEYIVYGIGRAVVLDGLWHTYVRDLQADLQRAQPGVEIEQVNSFIVRGSGRVDDVLLYRNPAESELPSPTDVTLSVNSEPVLQPSANHLPVAGSDSYPAVGGKANRFEAGQGLLANDFDPDGDLLRAILVDLPAHGRIVLAADGSFSYIAQSNFSGTDQFTYLPFDGKGYGNVVSVRIDVQPSPRITEGLVALYDFQEGAGNTVYDRSGFGSPLDLTISDPTAVRWIDSGGLSLDAPVIISSPGSAAKVAGALQQTNALTVEAWVKPANTTQSGPARIVTNSSAPTTMQLQNFMMGVGHWNSSTTDVVDVRLLGTNVNTAPGSLQAKLTHLVFTRDSSGRLNVYIDGVLQLTDTILGDFSVWDIDRPLVVGNEPSGDRPFLGEIYLIGIYDRALSISEIQANYSSFID